MTNLQERIITYVTKVDALVSLEKLIAVSSAVGFSEGEVLAALSGIGNKLKSTVRGGVVYYQVPPPKKDPIVPRRPDYQREELGESPFKVCFCAHSHVHWKPEMGHFKDCDSMVYPEEYKKQNPWDATAGQLVDQEWYDNEVNKQKAIRKKRGYG